MSSNFFIRSAPKNGPGSSKKLGKRKTMVHTDKKTNKSKKSRPSLNSNHFDNEEISSEEDEPHRAKPEVDTDEDEFLTPQEKKLKLAKKYLKEIEDEEKAKLDVDEIGDDVILGRLKEDVLNQSGRLRRKVYDKIKTEYNTQEFKILKCKEHKLAITCLTVSEDCLYTGSKDCTVIKWSLIEMKKIGKIPARHKNKSDENLHNSPIFCLAVSPDNKYLASGDDSNVVRIWDVKTLQFSFSFKGHRGGVTGLAFCRQGLNLYSCSKDRTVKVWSVAEKAYIETLFGHQSPITDLDVLGKDRVLTSGGVDSTVRVWKIQEESQLIFNGHERSIDCVKRLDDQHFVSSGDEGSICLWGLLKKKPLFVQNPSHGVDPISEEPHWVTALACLSNTEIFASGSSNGQVLIWKCDDNYRGAQVLAKIPVVGFINALAFTRDQSKLIVGVGQEHKLGRWSRLKEAKNSIVVINIQKSDLNL